MFKPKNALIALAVSMLVAACGGGGGDDKNTTPPPSTSPDGGGNKPPGGDDNTPKPDPVEVALEGHLELGNNQLIFNRSATRGGGIPLQAFMDAGECGGVYGQAAGTDAPLSNFGFRVAPRNMALVADQTANARIAVEMLEQASSGVAGQEQLQLMIDSATVTVTPANAFTVTPAATAKMYLTVKSEGGQPVTIEVTDLPANVIALETIAEDPEFSALTVNLDAAIARAKAQATAANNTAVLAALNGLVDFAGRFDMNATISYVNMKRQSLFTGEPSTTSLDLVGKAITVGTQRAVKGGGVQGNIRLNEGLPASCPT